MAYAQIDVDALDHWKVGGLSAEAFRTWVAGLCYCQKHLTDGALDPRAVKMLRAKTTPAVVAELVEAGLWHEGPAGYVVHDFTTWNRTRAEVEKQREKWRRKKGGTPGGSKGDSPGEPTGESPEIPRTDTIRSATQRSETHTSAPPAPVCVAPGPTEQLLEHWRAVAEQHGVLEPAMASPRVEHQARALLAVHALDVLRRAVTAFWDAPRFIAARNFGLFASTAGQLVAHVQAGHRHRFGERAPARAALSTCGEAWCHHEPPCQTQAQHTLRDLDARRAAAGIAPRGSAPLARATSDGATSAIA